MSARLLGSVIAVAIIAIGLCMLGATYLPSYSDCQTYGANESAERNKADANQLPPKTVTDNTIFDCEGAVANANGNAITAIATVLLTIVTGGLVLLGWHQFVVSRTQTRAHIFPTSFNTSYYLAANGEYE